MEAIHLQTSHLNVASSMGSRSCHGGFCWPWHWPADVRPRHVLGRFLSDAGRRHARGRCYWPNPAPGLLSRAFVEIGAAWVVYGPNPNWILEWQPRHVSIGTGLQEHLGDLRISSDSRANQSRLAVAVHGVNSLRHNEPQNCSQIPCPITSPNMVFRGQYTISYYILHIWTIYIYIHGDHFKGLRFERLRPAAAVPRLRGCGGWRKWERWRPRCSWAPSLRQPPAAAPPALRRKWNWGHMSHVKNPLEVSILGECTVLVIEELLGST